MGGGRKGSGSAKAADNTAIALRTIFPLMLPAHPALAQQRTSPPLLLLLLLPLIAVLAPAAAHTYPNYIFPPNSRTSHATSALTLSGDRLSILQPQPRRAVSVANSSLAFAVELLRTCSAGGGSGSSSSSSMDCSLFLDGVLARDVSLPCDRPYALTLTAAAAGASAPRATSCAHVIHAASDP